MSNEWNNLSESYKSGKPKNMASVKLKKKSIIYKHIVIKKHQKQENSPESTIIEIKNEFPILSKIHQNPRSGSFSFNKNCEKFQNWLQKPVRSFRQTNYRETSLELNPLSGRPDLSSYLMNSRINLGQKLQSIEHQKILKTLTKTNLKVSNEAGIFKFFFNEKENSFNVVVFGVNAPVSDCCKINMVVQVSNDYGGRILCPSRNCVIKFISNFCIEKNERDLLWPVREIEGSEVKKVKNKDFSNDFLKSFQPVNDFTALGTFSTLTVPSNKISPFTDPLQQLLRHHKRLSY
jgi:hypothetical protein